MQEKWSRISARQFYTGYIVSSDISFIGTEAGKKGIPKFDFCINPWL